MSVVGSGSPLEGDAGGICRDLGRTAVDAGFRIATGGKGGVMEAVSLGAHESSQYSEGDVIGVLPSYDVESGNPHVDIVVPTGLGIARNIVVVAMADVVVAIGGSSGTLSEMAIAWQLGKPIVAIAAAGGWAEKLAGERIDARRQDRVVRADDGADAVAKALDILGEEWRAPSRW
jgi:uncharacterized protein (TIGR00725 family)